MHSIKVLNVEFDDIQSDLHFTDNLRPEVR